MSLKRLFLAAVLAVAGFSGLASAQSSTNSASSGSSSSAPGCDEACCFKQSVVDGKTKFECVSNWCQQSCELVYPKGADGKPDFNKKPTCGCQAAPPQPPPPPPGGSSGDCASKTTAAQCGGDCMDSNGKVGQCYWSKGKCACTLNPCFELGIGRCGGKCTGGTTGISGVCGIKTFAGIKRCGCDNGQDVLDNAAKAASSMSSHISVFGR